MQAPAEAYLPAGQPVQSARRAEPVAWVKWPAGQSRQEDEARTGWYFEAGQEVQTPAARYLPAAQAVQSARRLEPVPVVVWPAGQSRQEVEAESGWYFEAGQDTHADTGGAQSLKPIPLMPSSEWKAKLVLAPDSGKEAGNTLLDVVSPQYLVPPSTCR